MSAHKDRVHLGHKHIETRASPQLNAIGLRPHCVVDGEVRSKIFVRKRKRKLGQPSRNGCCYAERAMHRLHVYQTLLENSFQLTLLYGKSSIGASRIAQRGITSPLTFVSRRNVPVLAPGPVGFVLIDAELLEY